MASGVRPSRKSSRNSSPFPRKNNDPSAPVNPIYKERAKTFMDHWVEPPLRPPAPSFEDHRGLERQGVLLDMAPLGSLPTAKVKTRAKGEPHRRVLQVKDELVINEEMGDTPDPPASAPGEPTDPIFEEEEAHAPLVPLQVQVKLEREDKDYVPTGQKIRSSQSKTATPPLVSTQASSPPPSPVRRIVLESAVEAACERARVLGNYNLGRAVKNVYQQSFQDESIARLFQTVIEERATEEEAARFERHIQGETKALDMLDAKQQTQRSAIATGGQKSKYPSISPSKSIRQTASPLNDRNHNSKTQVKSEGRNRFKSKSPQKAAVDNGNVATVNGEMVQKKPPTVQLRKSSSMSSLSTLSSVDEEVVQAGPPNSSGDNLEEVALRNAENCTLLKKNLVRKAPVTADNRVSLHGPASPNHMTARPTMHRSLKRSSAEAGLPVDERDDSQDAVRSKYAKTFNDDVHIQTSNVRDPLPESRLPPEAHISAPTATELKPPSNGVTPYVFRDQTIGLTSPFSEAFIASSAVPSRKGTPNALGTRPKKVQRAARVKISPVKKNKGVVAGLAPSAGVGDSPVGYMSDNNDYCSACGGSGYLLCCDGCDRSFHFTCLDPPLDQNASFDEPWYCCICEAKREPPIKPPRGLFAELLVKLEKCNPSAYSLPLEIRDYFEGVKTGEEGEYEEAVTQKASKTRTGYDEVPDYHKLKDAKGNVVLCYACGKSSLDHQAIIQCDFCLLQWHLDCLDPPLANPPSRGTADKARNQWMCPAHVDPELLAVRSRSNGRTRKVRRPRNAVVKDTALRRGFVNNGIIEIENESSDDETFFEEEDDMGTVYRLPERGIKLDFIAKVKQLHIRELLQQETPAAAPTGALTGSTAAGNTKTINANNLPRPSFIERKTVLNLAQFAHGHKDLKFSSNGVVNLVSTLIVGDPDAHEDDVSSSHVQSNQAEAPADVVAQMSEAEVKAASNESTITNGVPPSPPSSEQTEPLSQKEKSDLMALAELIKRKLEGSTKTAD